MDFQQILGQLIIGALIGWIAANLTHSKGGLVRNIIIGVLGSYLGSVLADAVNISPTGQLSQLAFSIAGACVLLVGGKALFK